MEDIAIALFVQFQLDKRNNYLKGGAMITLKKNSTVGVAVAAGIVLAIKGSLAVAGEPSGQEVKSQVDQQKYLVLDSRIIESTQNAKLTLGEVKKHAANPLFKEDKPWEPRFDNLYANIFYDQEEQLYKCWYSPFIICQSTTETPREQWWKYRYQGEQTGTDREMGVCYAFSKDGIQWEKPELGIVEFGGNKKNNIVMRRSHGASVFKDLRELDAARRYKLFCTVRSPSNILSAAFSADGLHWNKPISCPEAGEVGGIHQIALSAPALGKYVAFTRLWGERGRLVGRTESVDFVNWTKAQVVLEGSENNLQTYTMPVFPYAGFYLGLPAIINDKTDRVHAELAWSPDTIKWHRICPGTPLIPNSEVMGEDDWGTVYAAANPIVLDKEIRLYYGGCNGMHGSWREGFLCLATLRPDGWAGYEPTSKDSPAFVTTKTVTGDFSALRITADVQDGGSVRVAVVDEHGKQLAHGEPVKNTVTNGKIIRKSASDGTAISGKKYRLKFELHDAKLYSFQM